MHFEGILLVFRELLCCNCLKRFFIGSSGLRFPEALLSNYCLIVLSLAVLVQWFRCFFPNRCSTKLPRKALDLCGISFTLDSKCEASTPSHCFIMYTKRIPSYSNFHYFNVMYKIGLVMLLLLTCTPTEHNHVIRLTGHSSPNLICHFFPQEVPVYQICMRINGS